MKKPITDKFYTLVNSNEGAPFWQEAKSLHSFDFNAREFFITPFAKKAGFTIVDAQTGRNILFSFLETTERNIQTVIKDLKDNSFELLKTATDEALSPRYSSDVTLEIKLI